MRRSLLYFFPVIPSDNTYSSPCSSKQIMWHLATSWNHIKSWSISPGECWSWPCGEQHVHFRGAHASQPSLQSKAFPSHFGKVTAPQAWWLKIFMGYHGFPTACQNLVDDGQSPACHIPCLCTAESDWQLLRTSDKLGDLLLYHLVLGFFSVAKYYWSFFKL